MVNASPSTSTSFMSSVVSGVSSAVCSSATSVSAPAVGASLTGVTVIEIVAVAWASPSSTVTVTASVPW